MEQSFPRGKKPVETEAPSTKKKRSSDFLFGSSETSQNASKKKRPTNKLPSSSAQSLLPLGGGAVLQPTKGEPYIEGLAFQKLGPGMKLLACVKEILDNVVVFSLPNLWTGFMLRDDAQSHRILSVHQYISVQIVKAVSETTKDGPKRRIQVTCLPDINPRELSAGVCVRGQVLSVEDHGVVVDLGYKRRGFLAYPDIEESYSVSVEDEDDESTSRRLHVGRIDDFNLESPAASSKIFKLTLPSRTKMAHQIMSTTLTLQSLQPGTLVKVQVEKALRNGLAVTLCKGVFRGAIELAHLGGYWPATTRNESTDWKEIFNSVPSLTARIHAVDPATKIIRLSLLPHLLALRQPPRLPQIGTVLHKATVSHLDPGVGAILTLPFELESIDKSFNPNLWKQPGYEDAARRAAVYVHISKATDDKTPEATFAKEFAPSTQHSVRILSTSNYLENMGSGATANSVVTAHVLTHADLVPGNIYRQVPVCAHGRSGVLVDFGLGVRGCIPEQHLFDHAAASSDFRNKIRNKLFAVGAKVDVRVLTVDSGRKKCLLTAKKALLKANSVLTSFDAAVIGQVVTGFVSRADSSGLSVTFFNNAYGRATARSLMVEMGVENVAETYQIGDVVECRIVNIKRRFRKNAVEGDDDQEMEIGENGRNYWELTLSLKVDDDGNDGAEPPALTTELSHRPLQIRVGAVLPQRSLRIMDLVYGREKTTGFVPGYALVSVKSKYLVDDETDAEASAPDPMYVECKLPFDQLLDDFDPSDIESAACLDALAKRLLTVGKKVNRKGIVLTDPEKAISEYSSGTGKLAVVSVREKLVDAMECLSESGMFLPKKEADLFVGASVLGYVVQVDPRHGAFVRFLDGLTGMVDKKGGGLDMPLFSTVITRVAAIDRTAHPPRILLSRTSTSHRSKSTIFQAPPIRRGDVIAEVEVISVDFHRAMVKILDESAPKRYRARLHCTLANSETVQVPLTKPNDPDDNKTEILKHHPLFDVKVGCRLSNLVVVAANIRDGILMLDLTNRPELKMAPETINATENHLQLVSGTRGTGIVTGIDIGRGGVWLQIAPGVSAFLPCLEVSQDLRVLRNIQSFVPIGVRIECVVLQKDRWIKVKSKSGNNENQETAVVSVLELTEKPYLPRRGDTVAGRVNASNIPVMPPALTIELRGGYVGRCCICELEEPDDWRNMPLTQLRGRSDFERGEDQKSEHTGVSYTHGSYISCKILKSLGFKSSVDVSLRRHRMEGDVEDDAAPTPGDIVQAYVVETNKKGCFVRLSRKVEGRVMLKELSDGFLQNPADSFPPGRLVVGKVREVKASPRKGKGPSAVVDLDMRESVIVDSREKLDFASVKIGEKYKGIVTRIEDYGVFVRLENSNLSGLVHKSECSDDYVTSLAKLFDPGDPVKILVLKRNDEKQQLGFSMKPSHFADDSDSDNGDEDMLDDDSHAISGVVVDAAGVVEEVDGSDSEDDGHAHLSVGGESSDSTSRTGDDSIDDGEKTEEIVSSKVGVEGSVLKRAVARAFDTNVGFDWDGFGSSSHVADEGVAPVSESESKEHASSSHKSRHKQAQRLREEQEIARREHALADGTIDRNPETVSDFERLLASFPNSSEIWIKYMAYHLSVADIQKAREVAERAFGKVSFEQEGEKLNVWCALLTLELKYGNDERFLITVDRACRHNNPKQVYLRVCEMMEKQAGDSQSNDTTERTDQMYETMCKKFRSKKKVWLAYIEYLLRSDRQEQAHAMSKRAVQSLPSYKHVETMSKFAQLAFEYGSPERARTMFDGLILKYPKRLDLFFIYVDKEVKFGEFQTARALFERQVSSHSNSKLKLTDKQMKKFFKKWYELEDRNGSDETRERVKEAAREYVQSVS